MVNDVIRGFWRVALTQASLAEEVLDTLICNHGDMKTEVKALSATTQPTIRSTNACLPRCHWLHLVSALLVALCMLATGLPALAQHPDSLRTEEISFNSGGETLSGTMLVPPGPGPHPALVMLHGAGVGRRDQLREEAELFANTGILTLIYDKRTSGYSTSGAGARTYALLAEDALAAARVLQQHPDVLPQAVGVWGLSEGAWVAPMAAAGSDDIAFLVLVSATGVSPARQIAWNLETTLRHHGVTGGMIEASSGKAVRLFAEAGLIAEAHHDPTVALRQVKQPVLALWGDLDRIEPAAESAAIVREALAQGGNSSSTIHVFAGADHDLRLSPDGFAPRPAGASLAPGYGDLVVDWMAMVVAGQPPMSGGALPPAHAVLSRPLPDHWFGGIAAQSALVLGMIAALLGYPALALYQRLARQPAARHGRAVRSSAPLLVVSGLATIVGAIAHAGFIVITGAADVSPVVAGRPLVWLLLQMLALITVGAALAIVVSVSTNHRHVAQNRTDQARYALLVAATALFLPWAIYWELLSP
jgi:dienelactone hydrolase